MTQHSNWQEWHQHCSDDECVCPDDVFWGRLLGDDDPCAPGKDWVSAAFGESDGSP